MYFGLRKTKFTADYILPQFIGPPNVPAVKQMFEADDILNDYPRPEASDISPKVTLMFREIVSTVGFVLRKIV